MKIKLPIILIILILPNLLSLIMASAIKMPMDSDEGSLKLNVSRSSFDSSRGEQAVQSIAFLLTFNGSVNSSSINSWHYFHVASSITISASLSWASGPDLDMYLYRPSDYNTEVVKAYTSSNPETLSYSSNENGNWAIRVNYFSGSAASYTLSVTLSVDSDVTAPTVQITSPTNDTIVYRQTPIQVTANDDKGLSHVDFFIDNNKVGTDNLSPFTYVWDTTAYSNQGYVLKAQAVDYLGHTTNSTVVNVIVNQSAAPIGDIQRFAVIVGISDYKTINDLSYCDEDANDWYNYFRSVLYINPNNTIILGDNTSTYTKKDGLATEANIRTAINEVCAAADNNDEIYFCTSGHGGGGNDTFLCAWDCGDGENGYDGYLTDIELAMLFTPAVAAKIFIFVDHCNSGGLLPELMALSNYPQMYITTTCGPAGSGYDSSEHQNGMWTYYFLEAGLIGHFSNNPDTSMETAFTWAFAQYGATNEDAPMQADGTTSTAFAFTNPHDVDSDQDGLDDYSEHNMYGTNLFDPDTDHDSYSDYDEIFVYHTNPLVPDLNPIFVLAPLTLSCPPNAVIDCDVTAFNGSALTQVLYHWNYESGNTSLNSPYDVTAPAIEGLFTLYIYCQNALGQWKTNSFNFTIDGQFPLIYLLTPQNNTLILPQSINFNISDSHLVTVMYQWDTGAIVTLNSPFNILNPPNGYHFLTVWAMDLANNTNEVVFTFTFDGIAPIISITGATNFQVFDSPIDVHVTVSDDNLANVWYAWEYSTTNITASANFDATMNHSGWHVLTIYASDSLGNLRVQIINICFDDEAPVIILSAENNTFFTFGATINATIIDTSLQSVTYNWNGNYNTTMDPPYIWTLLAYDGTYILNLYVCDSSNTWTVVSYIFTVDSTAPICYLNSPANNSVITTASTLEVVYNELNIAMILYSWDDGANNVLNINDLTSIIIPSTAGSHSLKIYCEDKAGNSCEVFYIFTIQTPPNVTPTPGFTALFTITCLISLIIIRKTHKA